MAKRRHARLVQYRAFRRALPATAATSGLDTELAQIYQPELP